MTEDTHCEHDVEHVERADRDGLEAEQPDERARPGSCTTIRSPSRVPSKAEPGEPMEAARGPLRPRWPHASDDSHHSEHASRPTDGQEQAGEGRCSEDADALDPAGDDVCRRQLLGRARKCGQDTACAGRVAVTATAASAAKAYAASAGPCDSSTTAVAPIARACAA